jgi:hypothetical protein
MSSFFVVIPRERPVKSLTTYRRQGPIDLSMASSWSPLVAR